MCACDPERTGSGGSREREKGRKISREKERERERVYACEPGGEPGWTGSGG